MIEDQQTVCGHVCSVSSGIRDSGFGTRSVSDTNGNADGQRRAQASVEQRRAQASACPTNATSYEHRGNRNSDGTTVAISPCIGVHAAPRPPGFDYIGPYAYSVTCCTFSRHAWFVDAAAVDAVRAQLLHYSKDEGIARWKQKTGYYHRHATNTALWQGGFFDHILREEEDRDKLVRYILANPIRAGLVMDVREYPFWGSGVCSREELIAALFDRPAP